MFLKNRLSGTALIALFLITVSNVNIMSRGPSTAEERAKALTIIRSLEVNPIQDGYKEKRKWLMDWLNELPDISIKVCREFLDEMQEEGNGRHYGVEIYLQSIFSSAAFIIEHPEKSKDKVAIYEAGLRGSLKVYSFLLSKDPLARRQYLDDMVEKERNGQLTEVARLAIRNCI